jgi:protease I
MKVLIPLPSKDFDPTEAGVSFKILKENGIELVIATPHAEKSIPDLYMLTGKKLGPLKNSLMADKNGVAAFHFMEMSSEYQNPISYSQINVDDFDGILLPGGHDKGMREYLESSLLQKIVLDFKQKNKKIAAICHGVIVLARTKDENNKSIIADYKVTSLLKKQELLAYKLTKFYLDDYYLTYPETVEDEVKRNLNGQSHFQPGPMGTSYLGVSLLKRDSQLNLKPGFIVVDRNLITARWPGDAHTFANAFVKLLKGQYS